MATDKAAQELQSLLGAFEGLEGDFIQTTKDSEQLILQQQSGHFLMRNPTKLRWQVYQPWTQLIVADGESVWLYDEDLQQVTRRAWSSQPENNPAMLLLDSKVLADYYLVSEKLVSESLLVKNQQQQVVRIVKKS